MSWATNFPFRPPPKKFRFQAMGHFLGLTPVLAVPRLCQIISISTLNFGPFQRNLVETSVPSKKMTQNNTGPCPGRNYGETTVFTFSRKVVFWLKMHFNPKNTQIFLRDWYLFGKKHFFLWTIFSGRGKNMVREWMKWMFFWGPKSWFLIEKSNFCHTTPILVNGPFVALGETVHFPPWELFYD